MSLTIIKNGVLDLVQDTGRYGWQHLGINPGGAIDRWSAQLANLLVGNEIKTGLLEFHFPAAELLFESRCLIAISGADFSPQLNGEPISGWQPVLVDRNSVLQFKGWKTGARCYLAIGGGLILDPWLSSYSTNLRCAAGGYQGRPLKQGDIIPYHSFDNMSPHLTRDTGFHVLPWKADWQWNKAERDEILIVAGNEWDHLKDESKVCLQSGEFMINQHSDRMGYRLEASLESNASEEMVSAAVSFGTVQLLPNGHLIVLMADHQTTGGYPRIAHVLSTSLPRLAQKKPGEAIRFRMTDIAEAEELLLKQNHHLLQLQNACTFRLQHFLHANQH